MHLCRHSLTHFVDKFFKSLLSFLAFPPARCIRFSSLALYQNQEPSATATGATSAASSTSNPFMSLIGDTDKSTDSRSPPDARQQSSGSPLESFKDLSTQSAVAPAQQPSSRAATSPSPTKAPTELYLAAHEFSAAVLGVQYIPKVGCKWCMLVCLRACLCLCAWCST